MAGLLCMFARQPRQSHPKNSEVWHLLCLTFSLPGLLPHLPWESRWASLQTPVLLPTGLYSFKFPIHNCGVLKEHPPCSLTGRRPEGKYAPAPDVPGSSSGASWWANPGSPSIKRHQHLLYQQRPAGNLLRSHFPASHPQWAVTPPPQEALPLWLYWTLCHWSAALPTLSFTGGLIEMFPSSLLLRELHGFFFFLFFPIFPHNIMTFFLSVC